MKIHAIASLFYFLFYCWTMDMSSDQTNVCSRDIEDMEDSKDTIIVQNIGSNVGGGDFINHFSKIGVIKTDRTTGQRMAIMRKNEELKTQEGIVTYKEAGRAQEAVVKFNNVELKGNKLKVQTAVEFWRHLVDSRGGSYCQTDQTHSDQNMAWRSWFVWPNGFPIAKVPKGGQGGEGGGGLWGFMKGEDGEPGEDGPGGRGGRGGAGGGFW